MNKGILIVIALLLIPIVSAIDMNKEYEVYSIDRCFNDVVVKIRSEYVDIENDYYLVNCNKENLTFWKCKCNLNGKTSIGFVSNTESIYDVVIEYYIKPITNNNRIDDNNKRTLNFNNLEFGKQKKSKFKLPDIKQANLIFAIIFFIVIVFSFIIYLIIRKIVKSDDNIMDSEKKKVRKKKKNKEEEFNGFKIYK